MFSATQMPIVGGDGAAKATPADIAAIGVTNQRETTILRERDGILVPVANAIAVWRTTVTAPICDGLEATSLKQLFRRKQG